MNNKKCSVIIPVYNGEQFLRQTIDCFLAQDYIDKELILVDDASPDDSFKIIQTYKKRYPDLIHVVIHNENKGLVKAFLSGIQASNGAYISVIGQDDIMFDNRLTTLINALEEKHVSMVCSNAWFLYGEEPSKRLVRPFMKTERRITSHMFYFRNPVIGPSALFRKEDFYTIDKSIFRFRNSMERIHWFQYTAMRGIYYLPTPLLFYRKHFENLSKSIFQTPEYIEYKNFCRKQVRSTLTPKEILLAWIDQYSYRTLLQVQRVRGFVKNLFQKSNI
jgi:teichuronic acid biosynthesis glycosyltransferase TuaG